jgi:hypothetical protein
MDLSSNAQSEFGIGLRTKVTALVLTMEALEGIRDLLAFLATLQTPTPVLLYYRPGLPRLPRNRLTTLASVPSPNEAKVIFLPAR